MNTIHTVRLMHQLHLLILKEETGSSKDLSNILNVSRRTVQDYLKELRTLGAELSYDQDRNTYFYRNDFYMNFVLEIKTGECHSE